MQKKSFVLAEKLCLTFSDWQLFERALTHRSVGSQNNERLEFLGDSILGFIIAEKLYDTFPKADEGTLSRLRASLVNESALADLARELGLGDYLHLGSGELKSGGFRRDSILSDALEAIIGALYKDQGFTACRDLINRWFKEQLGTLSEKNSKKDAKTQLQELMQAKRMELPEYTLVDMIGLAHEQTFTVQCSVSLPVDACLGTGVSRKKAEQAAAEQMLLQLQKINL